MSRQLPSQEAALMLLAEKGCSRGVAKHCLAVSELAVEIAKACRERRVNVNVDLVRIGGLLHDIGRARTHGVDHAIEGSQIVKSLNLPDAIARIVERHVGSGITAKEAEKLGWPVKSYVPTSIEERIVAYADKLIEGSRRVSIETAVERFRNNADISEESIERLRQWHEELSPPSV